MKLWVIKYERGGAQHTFECAQNSACSTLLSTLREHDPSVVDVTFAYGSTVSILYDDGFVEFVELHIAVKRHK